jgi:hypothetical protein
MGKAAVFSGDAVTPAALRDCQEAEMDTRTDNLIAEVEVRSEDFQETKSLELFPQMFRANGRGEVDFADPQTRDKLLDRVAAAILVVAAHELEIPPEAEEK